MERTRQHLGTSLETLSAQPSKPGGGVVGVQEKKWKTRSLGELQVPTLGLGPWYRPSCLTKQLFDLSKWDKVSLICFFNSDYNLLVIYIEMFNINLINLLCVTFSVAESIMYMGRFAPDKGNHFHLRRFTASPSCLDNTGWWSLANIVGFWNFSWWGEKEEELCILVVGFTLKKELIQNFRETVNMVFSKYMLPHIYGHILFCGP